MQPNRGETWGFLYDLVGFPIRYVSYCILMYLAVYLDVSRSYTLRYTKIHQDTSRYICIYLFGYHGNVSYLGICTVSFFTVHLGYIHDTFQDTMYLNPQIHDTQDTLTIHVGYIGIHSRIRISSPTCGRAWMRAGTNLRYMYLIMYLGCIPHVS